MMWGWRRDGVVTEIRLPESIETERLVLRPWTEADVPALYAAVDASRERIGAWLPWVAFYTDPSAAATFVARARQGWLTGTEVPLAVVERASGRILGGVGFHGTVPGDPIRWEHGVIETGYWLRDGEEGKGYMREAVRAEIRLVFAHLGLDKLVIRADARNRPSRRVAEALGFQLDAILRNHLRTDSGELRDTCVFSLLRDEALPLIAGWSNDHVRITWSERPVTPPEPPPEPPLPDGASSSSSSSSVMASRYSGTPCSLRWPTTFSTSSSETKGPCTRWMRPPPAM